VITLDRPGLLAHIAQIFLRFGLRVLTARIATLGERVEDIFHVTDADHQPLVNLDQCQQLREALCNELDQRNRADSAGHSETTQINLNGQELS